MEPTIIPGAEITVRAGFSDPHMVRIEQGDDVIVFRNKRCEEFVAAVRKYVNIIEEPEPTPEKWYVVLRGSNCRLTNSPGVPTIFTDYDLAKRYGRQHGMRSDRWYLPMSVDNYERVFGR